MLLSHNLHGIWLACSFYRMAVRNGEVKDRGRDLEDTTTTDASERQVGISIVFRDACFVDFLYFPVSGSFGPLPELHNILCGAT